MAPQSGEDDTALDPRVVRTRADVLHAAIGVLVEEGWDKLTHRHVAEVAGYSKATVYAHWPTRTDLLRETFSLFRDMPHHRPSGDLREDLVAELTMFRTAMQEYRLDRVLAVLADVAGAEPALAPVREEVVASGEHLVRDLLATVFSGGEAEAAAHMLCGVVLNPTFMHGRLPDDDLIRSAVDLLLRAAPGRSAT